MIAPIYPMYVRDADKKIMYDEHGNKIYDSGVNTNQIRSFSGGANPMISIDLDRHRTYTDAINGNWFATVTPVEGLNVTANISASAINRRANHLYNSYYGSYIGKGSVSVAQSRTFGVNQQYLASYKRTFAPEAQLRRAGRLRELFAEDAVPLGQQHRPLQSQCRGAGQHDL